MSKFQNFGRLPGQPRLPAPFSQAVGRKSKFRFFPHSSCFQKGMTRPPCPKTPGGDRFGRNPLFGGPGLTPNFWAGSLKSKALGVRPGPPKGPFLPNLTPPWVLVPCQTFSRKKCWERNFDFWPKPSKMQKARVAGGGWGWQPKFLLKGTLAKIMSYFLFYAIFCLDAPPAPSRVKMKSLN